MKFDFLNFLIGFRKPNIEPCKVIIGCSSRLVTNALGIIVGRSKAANPPPIVALADGPALSAFADVLAGLKVAGVAEETASSNSRLPANVKLVEGVEVHATTSEAVGPDGQVGVSPDLRVPREVTADRALDAAVALVLTPSATTVEVAPPPFALQPARDEAYPEMTLPNADYRLLALFRLWSVTRYFFPYADLMDRPWGEALAEFLSDATAVQERLGLFVPPFLVSQVEGQAVVLHVHDPNAVKDIRVGDVILAVDGVAMAGWTSGDAMSASVVKDRSEGRRTEARVNPRRWSRCAGRGRAT
jgi:hypothetical protein